jgi:hypothetical protein
VVVATAVIAVLGVGLATAAVQPPANVAPPRIKGTATEGKLLRADVGTWERSTVRGAVYAFQWQTCDTAGASCTDVPKATDSVYPLRHEDVDRTLRAVVTATVDGKSTPAASEPTDPVAAAEPEAPVTTVRPTNVGQASQGKVLTVEPGTWTGRQPIQLRFRWRSCDVRSGACRELRATGRTYRLRKADRDHVLRVLVTAQNAVTSSVSSSDPTPVVGPPPGVEAPKATREPAISGTPRVGAELRTTVGAWTGTKPIKFSFRWRRCQGAGRPDASDCRTIDGAKGAAYVLRPADVGARLRAQVTASNKAGSATSTSNPTGEVERAAPAPAVPRARREPTISGRMREGQTVTATRGDWVGTAPIAYAFQWVRCGPGGGAGDGSNCPAIGGATGRAYKLTRADVGSRLRVRVTASNSVGSKTVASNPTSRVQAAAPPVRPPRNTGEPSIAGTPVQGQTLSANGGAWSGAAPITYAYQWVRCPQDGGSADGGNCAVIAGATTTKYVLSPADVGYRFRVRVTARNSQGAATAASNATSTVQPPPATTGPPRNTSEPSTAGVPKQGQTLTANVGAWAGAGPLTYSYQWVRCGADGGLPDGSNCPAIPGATAPKYAVGTADIGHKLRVRVTARNAIGTLSTASNATQQITRATPELPPGAVRLPSGKYSIPITSVSLPTRLVIDKVTFTPNPVRSRRIVLQLRVHVVDTRGYVVRDALVFGRGTPLVTTPAGERRTGVDGWATLRMVPRANFPIRNGYNVQFFVRARKPGENILRGVAVRRLVQVQTSRR